MVTLRTPPELPLGVNVTVLFSVEEIDQPDGESQEYPDAQANGVTLKVTGEIKPQLAPAYPEGAEISTKGVLFIGMILGFESAMPCALQVVRIEPTTENTPFSAVSGSTVIKLNGVVISIGPTLPVPYSFQPEGIYQM